MSYLPRHRSCRSPVELVAESDMYRSSAAALDALTSRTHTSIRLREFRVDVAAHIMLRSLHRQAQRLGLPVRFDELHGGLSSTPDATGHRGWWGQER